MRNINKVGETSFIQEYSRVKREKMKEVESIRLEFDAIETSSESGQLRGEKSEILKGKVEAVIESLSHLVQLNKEGKEYLCEMISKEHKNTIIEE